MSRLTISALAGLALVLAAAIDGLVPPSPMELPTRDDLVLRGVTVLQPGIGRLERQTLRIRDGRIASIEPTGAETGGPYTGAYVIPGLIDMNVHFPPSTPLLGDDFYVFLFLRHGVTTVREVGDADASGLGPEAAGGSGSSYPGPRVVSCRAFLDGGPEPAPGGLAVHRPADAAGVVASLAAAGSRCASLRVQAYREDEVARDTLASLRSAARRAGLPVIGHVPRAMPYEAARLADVHLLSGVAHLPHTDPRFTPFFPQDLAAWEVVDAARVAQIVRTSLRYDIANTPSLVVFERLARMRDYHRLRESPDARLMPRFYRDVVWSPVDGLPLGRGLDERDFLVLDAALASMRSLVGALHRAGARIFAGTNVPTSFIVPGASLHRELQLLAESGLSAEGALVSATRHPGEFLGVPGLGRIEPGAPADLVVLRDDPSRDLGALETLDAVVAGGRLYTREALDAQLARYRAHFEGPVFDAASMAVARNVIARMFDEKVRQREAYEAELARPVAALDLSARPEGR